jgi:hypothetical protein
MATYFIEGLPGSGKSSAAEFVATQLQVAKLPCKLFQEMTPEHPLRVGELDEIGAAMADIHLRYKPQEFANLALAKYQALAKASAVFESFPIQSHLRVLFQMNASPKLLWSFWDELQETIATAHPRLIYFQESLRGETLRAATAKRGQEWLQYIVKALEPSPYAQAHGLVGPERITRMLDAYGEFSDEVATRWRYPKLVLESLPISYSDREGLIRDWIQASS